MSKVTQPKREDPGFWGSSPRSVPMATFLVHVICVSPWQGGRCSGCEGMLSSLPVGWQRMRKQAEDVER